MGNKSDLADKREVTFEEGQEMARHYGIEFIETSAKDTVNINECFSAMAKTVIEKLNKEDIHKGPDNNQQDLIQNRKELKSGCCS